MTDLRENFGWIIGSVTTAIAAAISWFVSSEIFIVLISVLVGFLSSYLLQTLTQKKAWEREYSVKIAEEVYGSLFRQLKWVVNSLEEKRYRQLNFGGWGEFQNDHRYFMVDEKFRTKLDEFLERVENFNSAVYELENTIVPKIANEETMRVFNVDTDEHAKLYVQYEKGRRPHAGTPNIIWCLITQTHPKDDILRHESEVSNVECRVDIKQKNKEQLRSDEISKFEEYWESCLRRLKEDKTYKFIFQENDKLLEETRKVKKELVKRIEKPWKI